MSDRIDELEKAALGDKPWQLTGEVSAQTRPENSMLEENVEFDQASRRGKGRTSTVFNCFFVYIDLSLGEPNK